MTVNDDIRLWLQWLEDERHRAVMLSEKTMIEQIEAHLIDELDRGDYDDDDDNTPATWAEVKAATDELIEMTGQLDQMGEST